MWSICRIDRNPYTDEIDYFEVQAAYRKSDLDMAEAQGSGFVGPDDKLVIIGPDGKVR